MKTKDYNGLTQSMNPCINGQNNIVKFQLTNKSTLDENSLKRALLSSDTWTAKKCKKAPSSGQKDLKIYDHIWCIFAQFFYDTKVTGD